MGNLLSWILGAAGLILCWLLWELIAALVGDAAWEATSPLRRPIWRAFVSASWPWPLLALLAIGAAAVAAGLSVLGDLRREGSVGIGLLLSGAAVMLIGPLLWRDARRERRRSAENNDEW